MLAQINKEVRYQKESTRPRQGECVGGSYGSQIREMSSTNTHERSDDCLFLAVVAFGPRNQR